MHCVKWWLPALYIPHKSDKQKQWKPCNLTCQYSRYASSWNLCWNKCLCCLFRQCQKWTEPMKDLKNHCCWISALINSALVLPWLCFSIIVDQLRRDGRGLWTHTFGTKALEPSGDCGVAFSCSLVELLLLKTCDVWWCSACVSQWVTHPDTLTE